MVSVMAWIMIHTNGILLFKRDQEGFKNLLGLNAEKLTLRIWNFEKAFYLYASSEYYLVLFTLIMLYPV